MISVGAVVLHGDRSLIVIVLLQFQRLATAMRKLRRAGKIGEFVSVFVNEKQVSYATAKLWFASLVIHF